jgi:hypothetical protein
MRPARGGPQAVRDARLRAEPQRSHDNAASRAPAAGTAAITMPAARRPAVMSASPIMTATVPAVAISHLRLDRERFQRNAGLRRSRPGGREHRECQEDGGNECGGSHQSFSVGSARNGKAHCEAIVPPSLIDDRMTAFLPQKDGLSVPCRRCCSYRPTADGLHFDGGEAMAGSPKTIRPPWGAT